MFTRQSLTPSTRRVSHKRSLLNKLVVQSAVFKHFYSNSSERKKFDRKTCTSNKNDRSLEKTAEQNPFKNFKELHKDVLRLESAHQEPQCTALHMDYKCFIPRVKPTLN
ncbi:hypothetical protein CHARACLAT_023140 [Characodon lateralis]|uniref:Uncharacterized protein n=1 Tax=Characodon lateralis TaxID=208331 RepID=A0ABU7EWB0_9TELE|nr:hypothetical protein [Characodon lateralis]